MSRADVEIDQDPWVVLGIEMDADDRQIRAAYLSKIKEYPPERDAEQFERVRDAYQQLRDGHSRTRRMILSVDPKAPLTSLMADSPPPRRFVGPKLWWTALTEE